MKKTLFFLSFCFSIICFSQTPSNYIENEVLVKFKNNFIKTETINNRFKTQKLRDLHTKLNVVKYQSVYDKNPNSAIAIRFNNTQFKINQVVELYQKTGLFEYVEPNYIATGSGELNTVPNDNFYSRQWALKNDGTFNNAPAISGADIEMELAWDIETGDPNMIIAVIDTGLKLNHPEFAGRIWNNTNEVMDGSDTDGNGFVDDLVAGWDFINNDNNPTDDHGHGTNVAGIAVATGNNNIGYAGVNWNSKIMICKALDNNNSGSYAAIAGSIYYAVDNGAKIISMSIGGSGVSTTLSNAIDYCYNNGVILVACMMNFNNNTNYYPAAYANTIAVGATDPDDTRSNPFFWDSASGSNFGNHIDLVAPGNYMYGLSHTSDTNYEYYWGGTSQATPLVSGVVSLLLAKKPNLTFEEIRTILRDSSEDQVGETTEDTPGFDIYYGYGRLNAYNALTHNLLGVTSVENTTSASVFPNPIINGEILNLYHLQKGINTIEVFNILGQNVLTKNLFVNDNSKKTISLPFLNTGLYLLKVSHEKHKSTNIIKLVVK